MSVSNPAVICAMQGAFSRPPSYWADSHLWLAGRAVCDPLKLQKVIEYDKRQKVKADGESLGAFIVRHYGENAYAVAIYATSGDRCPLNWRTVKNPMGEKARQAVKRANRENKERQA